MRKFYKIDLSEAIVKKFLALIIALIMIASSVLLVACQKTQQYDVIVHSLNGEPAKRYAFDENFVFPPAPVYAGHTFGGWYEDEDCTKIWHMPTELTSDVHIYAKWTPIGNKPVNPPNGDNPLTPPDENTVIITFNYNYSGAPSSTVKNVTKGDSVSFPVAPSRDGYLFDGWYNGNEKVTSLVASENVTLYAHWSTASSSDSVKVTYNYNYSGATSTVVNVTKGTVAGYVTPEPRSGYIFDGWYTLPSGGTYWSGAQAVNTDTMVYAHWSEEKYFVVFDTMFAREPQAVQEVSKGATINLTYTPVRSGYTFSGWYTSPSGVNQVTRLEVNANTVLYARWTSSAGHEHNFGGNYFNYTTCTVANCNVVGRDVSERNFDSDFVYDFNSDKQIEINNLYNEILSNINNTNVLVTKFNQFDQKISYVSHQDQVAYVLYSAYCNGDDIFYKNSNVTSEYFNDMLIKYYSLFGRIYNENRTAFNRITQGWSNDDKQYVLQMAELYSGAENNLTNAASRISNEYADIMTDLDEYYESASADGSLSNAEINKINKYYNDLYAKYGEFVNANNAIAKQSGYDNYMDYAYAEVYNREYTPQDVATMRNYVKQYIAPILIKVQEQYDEYFPSSGYSSYASSSAQNFVNLFSSEVSVFGSDSNSRTVVNYIADYFKSMTSTTSNQSINYFTAANEIFKNGNYYTGTEDGAYTYWIGNANTSIVYFGERYVDAFTFVHEFGHYYNGIYNGSMELSMDHDETQSQGDEMMFLAWLKHSLGSQNAEGIAMLECKQLLNILITIVQCCAVDEFEQAVYSNSYGTGQYKNGIDSSDYGDLYVEILESYCNGKVFNEYDYDYWMYVCVDSAAYYISYAMSALPSLEIFVKSQQNNLAVARQCYFKLYTFSDSSSVDTDHDGVVTYSEVLQYAGLDSPFTVNIYQTIASYLSVTG